MEEIMPAGTSSGNNLRRRSLAARFAYFVGDTLASHHAGKAPPPCKKQPKELWHAFWLYVNLLLVGSSLIVALPEFIVLLIIKATVTGWDHCNSVVLISLSGSIVASGILGCCLWGSSICVIVLQLVFAQCDLGLNIAVIHIGAAELASHGLECWTALVALLCACLELLDGLPLAILWTLLLVLRLHQDRTDFPLVNMYKLLPPKEFDKWMPKELQLCELYDLDTNDVVMVGRATSSPRDVEAN